MDYVMMRGVNMETLVEWDVNRVVLLVETLCDTCEYSCSIRSHAVSGKALAFMTIEGWLELGVKCLSHRHTLIGWCRTILECAHNQEVSPKSTSTSERNIVNVQGMDALDPSDLHPHAIPITYERIFRPDECKHLFPIVGKPFLKKHWPQQHNAYCKGMDEIRGWCKKGLPGNMGATQFSHVNLRKDKELKKALKAWIAKRIGLLPILYFGKDLKYAWDIHDAYLKVQEECEQQEGLELFELQRFSLRESSLNHEHEVESLMPQDQSMAYFTPKHVMLDVSDGEEYEVAPLGTGSLVELITKGLHMPMKEMPTTIQGVSQSINKIGPINAPSFENLYTHGKESSPLLDHCEDDSTLPSCEAIPKFSSLSEILDKKAGVSKKSLQNQKSWEKLLKNKTLKDTTNVAHPSTFSNSNAAQENVLDRGKKYKKSPGKAKGMGECNEITMVDMDIQAMEAIAVEGMHLADIDEISRVTVGLATKKLQHVKDFLQDHMDMLKLACQNIHQAQDRYKKYADEERRQVVFKEGDYVFLRVPEHSKSLKTGPTPKLLPRFCGPFKILKRVGSMAYKLKLASNSRVHPIFHVSRLRQRLLRKDNIIDQGVLVDFIEPPNLPHEHERILDLHDLRTRHHV
ncbi:hypothetical protein L7F22_006263 [Adiantum nelumboides]|nr:hypothetical protein [Adiantum nelumboides]